MVVTHGGYAWRLRIAVTHCGYAARLHEERGHVVPDAEHAPSVGAVRPPVGAVRGPKVGEGEAHLEQSARGDAAEIRARRRVMGGKRKRRRDGGGEWRRAAVCG